MKPWNNPYFETTCCNCGRTGWNKDAITSYLGVNFVCRGGCNPQDVAEYQLARRIAVINRVREERLLVSNGEGI